MTFYNQVLYIALPLILVTCFLIFIMMIVRNQRKARSDAKNQAYIKKQVNKYKEDVKQFHNLVREPPYRIRNLDILYDNVKSARDAIHITSNYADDTQLEIECEKMKVIRKIAYDYVFDAIKFCCDRYERPIIYLNKFKKEYMQLIPIEYLYNSEKKDKMVFRTEKFSAMVDHFLIVMHGICVAMQELCDDTERGILDENLNLIEEMKDKMKVDFSERYAVNKVLKDFDKTIMKLLVNIDKVEAGIQ